jgi:carboxyl-terminal processing protease
MKRLLRASAALFLIIATAAVASWVIWMPKADLRGVWRTEGYGYIIDVGAFAIDIYETSAVSCLRTLQIPAHLGLIRLVEGVNLGSDRGRLSMSFDGAIGAIRADRLDAFPDACAQGSPLRPGTAQENFDVFWAKMDEHYAFFDLHGVDWAARHAALRPGKDEVLTDDALFARLSAALAGLDDEHLTLSRENETFSPALRPDWYANRLEMRAVAWSSIPGGLTSVADTGLSYGFAAPGVGYISIAHMNVAPGFGTSLEAFAAKAIAPVAAAMAPARMIIVDVRTNPGGSDLIGLAYAGYFTATPVPVLSKTTRTSAGYTAPLHHVLQPQGGPVLSQPVILLTGPLTGSAAEIFTLAMRDLPQVKVLGTPTAGALSDVLDVTLPNGWTVGLSHQRYLDARGALYERAGIPPDAARPVDLAGFASGRDGLLIEALAMAPAP